MFIRAPAIGAGALVPAVIDVDTKPAPIRTTSRPG